MKDVVQKERKGAAVAGDVRRRQCVIINKALKKVSTSKCTGAMLSYMKVMHYGLMFPKACYVTLL